MSETAALATCGKTHAEHVAEWRSWRDDCDVCGYAQQDRDQCERGHPDDHVDWCGACGYDRARDMVDRAMAGVADALRGLHPIADDIQRFNQRVKVARIHRSYRQKRNHW